MLTDARQHRYWAGNYLPLTITHAVIASNKHREIWYVEQAPGVVEYWLVQREQRWVGPKFAPRLRCLRKTYCRLLLTGQSLVWMRCKLLQG